MRRLRLALAWALVGAGTALLAYPALAYGTGALRQARLAEEVRTLLGPVEAAGRPIAAARHVSARRPAEGEPLGTIEIPSIDVRAAFLEGVTDETLRAGPGHIPGTALPGAADVSVLAAHRDMHFRDLKDVANGDVVRLRLPGRVVEYRVSGRRIVEPTDTTVTQLRRTPVLRLVTCWPPNFIGPAPHRLVVSAVPVASETGSRRGVAARPSPPPGGAATTSLSPASERTPLAPLASVGTAGATVAGMAAFGAARSRRAWWFLPWFGGIGLALLTLLAAWAGPGLVKRTHVELSAHRRVVDAAAPRWGEPVPVGAGLYALGDVTLAGPAMEAFLRAQRILGTEIEITDSFRTHAQQAAAYAAKPGLAALPGASLHEVGLAIDLHTRFLAAHPEVRHALRRAGWRQFDPLGEPWHWSYGRTG